MPIKLSYRSLSDEVKAIDMELQEHLTIDDTLEAFKRFLSAVGYGINVEDEIELVKAHQSSDEKEFISRVRERFEEEEEEEEVEDSWGESITAMDREEQIKYSSEYDEDEKYHDYMGKLQLNPEQFMDKTGHVAFGFYEQPVDKLVKAYDKMSDPDYVGREYAEYIKGVRDPDTCTRCNCGECK